MGVKQCRLKEYRMDHNFAGFTCFFTKKRAKLLLFFELTKYFGKNLLIYLLFQLEGE